MKKIRIIIEEIVIIFFIGWGISLMGAKISKETTFINRQSESLSVRLKKDSLFEKSQETGLGYVLKLDPDRLLAPVYNALGHSSEAAQPYGGWESQQIAGHSLGHYLSALAGFVYSTGNKQAKEKLDYTVAKLKSIQRSDGYISGVPSSVFETAARGGNIQVNRFTLCGWWVPWYSTHKIYAGLIDAYRYGGNNDALEVVTKMCDWAVNLFKNTDDTSFQRMLSCEHGGMCTVFADMYEITGNKSYLTMAERFIDHEMIDPAERKRDILQGYHANTQIPKFIGIARLYELTGKSKYKTAAEFFFHEVADQRSYVIGGNSIGEHFGRVYKETLGRDTCETCNTYNMLKLADHLFSWEEDEKYAEFYETGLYNHILGSQDPDTGDKAYFLSTARGHFKVYGTPENSFWCCTGTGMENPERYNRFIWKKLENTLFLNLFIPSTVKVGKNELKLETSFPFNTNVTVTVLAADKENPPDLCIRVPEWLDGEMKIMSGDREVPSENTGKGYLKLSEPIAAGQSFSFELPMKLHIRDTRDKTGNFSILYGPIALAAELGTKNFPPSDTVSNQLALMNWPGIDVPSLIGDQSKLDTWVKLTDPATLTFTVDGSAVSNGKSLILEPFYAIHHQRYTVYFNTVDAGKTRNKKYENITYDYVEPGRQQPEIDHKMRSFNSETGYVSSVEKSWRDAHGSNGYFEYTMKFSTEKQNTLLVSYYDKDGPFGNCRRKFAITINGEKIADVELNGNGEDKLDDVEYEIPDSLIKKYEKMDSNYIKMKVRFVPADNNSYAGGIMDLRVLVK